MEDARLSFPVVLRGGSANERAGMITPAETSGTPQLSSCPRETLGQADYQPRTVFHLDNGSHSARGLPGPHPGHVLTPS